MPPRKPRYYQLCLLLNGRDWTTAGPTVTSIKDIAKVKAEFSKRNDVTDTRVLEGDYSQDIMEAFDILHNQLILDTLPGVDPMELMNGLDLARGQIEKGYGCDRDQPYQFSWEGLDVGKLLKLRERAEYGTVDSPGCPFFQCANSPENVERGTDMLTNNTESIILGERP